MSFVDVLVVLSREEKAAVNGARKPKGDHREVAAPAKRRFKQVPPPPIEIEDPMPRWEIFVRNEHGARCYVVSLLGEMKHSLAAQLGFWQFGEPFEAIDKTEAKSKAKEMMLALEEREQDEWLMSLR